MKKEYLGRWFKTSLDNKDEEKNEEIEIVRTEDDYAITSKNEKIKLIDLDLSGDYWKPEPYSEKELDGLQQYKTKKISSKNKSDDILGIKKSESETINLNDSNSLKKIPKQETTEIKNDDNIIFNDPVATMIKSIIQIQKQKNKKSEFPVSIKLSFDFDILIVIKLALETGASDLEIIQNIMKYINIDNNDIKRSIINELIPNESEQEIIMENREDKFNEILNEELNK